MDMGFYYMTSAGGRLAGTLLSGLTYQVGGLTLVLGTVAGMDAASGITVDFLKRVMDNNQRATALSP